MYSNETIKENILLELRNYIITTGKIPRVIDLKMGRIELENYNYPHSFGCYYHLVKELMESDFVKDNYNILYNRWIKNRSSMINGIQEFVKTFDRVPKQEEYIEFACKNGYYQKINWLFDDFNVALKEAIEHEEFLKVKFNEEEVIDNIRLLANKLGETPTYKEYLEYAKEKSLSTNLRQYNTWNYYIEKAGLHLNIKRQHSEEEILELFIKLMKKLNRVPLRSEFEKEPGYPSAFLIDKYFGSYNELLSLLELEKNHREKYEEYELKYFIDEYIEKHGKKPTKYSFDLEGGPKSSVYQKRFGSWSKAIEELTGEKHIKSNQFANAYLSNHGDLRPSYQEGIVDDIIGAVELEHRHDVYYKDIVNCEYQYTMDVLIEEKFIVEVAGMVSKNDFLNDGANLKEDIKKEYLRKLKHKIEIVQGTPYKLIIIFKVEKLDSILKKLSQISEKINSIDSIPKGKILREDDTI